jgi:Kef-type K+ transport system membrane component KefB
MHELVHHIALCILVAWLLGLAAQVARQPVFLAYLAAGFVLGPSGLRRTRSPPSPSSA